VVRLTIKAGNNNDKMIGIATASEPKNTVYDAMLLGFCLIISLVTSYHSLDHLIKNLNYFCTVSFFLIKPFALKKNIACELAPKTSAIAAPLMP